MTLPGPIIEARDVAAALCRHFEGLRLKPYLCPAGYPTQGYGTVNKPDGTKVVLTDPLIDKATAEEWLLHELTHTYIAGVLRASPGLIHYPKALGAIADFAYNLGVPRYRASTLRRRVDVQDWNGAKEQLKKWIYADGRVYQGLVKRRAAEAKLL